MSGPIHLNKSSEGRIGTTESLDRSRPIYPLHRSLTFWSGLLGLVFLGWAWAESLRYQSSVSWGFWTLSNSRSQVKVIQVRGGHGWWFGPWPQSFRSPLPASQEPPLQLRGFDLLVDGGTLGTRRWMAGHWSLMCAGVLVWVPALLWRARRRQRQMTETERMLGRVPSDQ